MSLASDLVWLEQLLEVGTAGASGHAGTIRRLLAQAEAMRDALYELYCDAADERLASLVMRGAMLEEYVRASYAWCARVVALLASITNGLRVSSGPDWSAVKAGFRTAEERYVAPVDALRDAVRQLPIDYASPVEPLRNLPHDVDALFAASRELHQTMAKRFG
jgi:hypothetical protein